MASITINIPDAVVSRVVSALCKENNLPVSSANAKQAVINYTKRCVVAQEARTAALEVDNKVFTDVNNTITLT